MLLLLPHLLKQRDCRSCMNHAAAISMQLCKSTALSVPPVHHVRARHGSYWLSYDMGQGPLYTSAVRTPACGYHHHSRMCVIMYARLLCCQYLPLLVQALCRSECATHPCPQLVLAACTALVAGGGITTERIFKHNPPPELVDRLAAAAGDTGWAKTTCCV